MIDNTGTIKTKSSVPLNLKRYSVRGNASLFEKKGSSKNKKYLLLVHFPEGTSKYIPFQIVISKENGTELFSMLVRYSFYLSLIEDIDWEV